MYMYMYVSFFVRVFLKMADHVTFVYKKSNLVHSRVFSGWQDTTLVLWEVLLFVS